MLIDVLTKQNWLKKLFKEIKCVKPSSNNGEGGKKGKERLDDILLAPLSEGFHNGVVPI
jgi:hypothetical protein